MQIIIKWNASEQMNLFTAKFILLYQKVGLKN